MNELALRKYSVHGVKGPHDEMHKFLCARVGCSRNNPADYYLASWGSWARHVLAGRNTTWSCSCGSRDFIRIGRL